MQNEVLILGILFQGEKTGFEIIQTLQSHQDDTFLHKEGDLYPLLHSLEKKHLIRSRTKESSAGTVRKFYSITGKGRGYVKHSQKDWQISKKADPAYSLSPSGF